MIPEFFQDDLTKEIEIIIGDRLYKDTEGNLVPIKFFTQCLPVLQSDDDLEPIPYIVVRMTGGEDVGGSESRNIVNVAIIVGIFDNDSNAQGHREILNIINLVYQRFQANPLLNNQYVYTGHFKWIVQEDDYHPFYFGAMELSFIIPAIRKEDYLA